MRGFLTTHKWWEKCIYATSQPLAYMGLAGNDWILGFNIRKQGRVSIGGHYAADQQNAIATEPSWWVARNPRLHSALSIKMAFFFLVSMVAAQSPKILSSEKTWQQECVQCSAKSTSGHLLNATAFALVIRQVHLHVHKSRGHVLKRSTSAILLPWPKACFNWLF